MSAQANQVRDVADWRGLRVLVIGDVMVDRFVYGGVERISPEAPIPVLRYAAETTTIGGAGNVARNIASLGGEAVLIGIAGTDGAGDLAAGPLLAEAGIEGHIVRGDGPTTVKTRFVADGQQMLRLDVDAAVPADDALAAPLLDRVAAALPGARAVVLSDYAKGVLSDRVIGATIVLAHARGVPVIVDPKRRDLSVYRGARVITPNALEASAATGLDTGDDDGAGRAALALLASAGAGSVVLTRGPRGMTIVEGDAPEPLHLPTVAVDVFDVSGAGDTVAAALALGIAAGWPVAAAAGVANRAAGIAVGKRGTAAVDAHELTHALRERSLAGLDGKIVANAEAVTVTRGWQARGLRVGFTNGCFDLVHPGHVALLRQARAACDRLVVAINSDASVRRLKGPARPVQIEMARAIVIAAIGAVDLVTIFDEDTPLELIAALRPDLLIKGADYRLDEVVGGDIVERAGGKVLLIDLQAGHSTSAMIRRAAS